ncbi:hypothetical protein WJX81_007040 [Elliptochloris bilobata]|uniref:CHCH domain-containing protein n=1 Tax=Elliptochloris bilobata TaxID=381761 RepID=A0AAW1QLK4_9CHLO
MEDVDTGPPPTSAVLMSISKHIAVRCKKPNAAFIACKKVDRNPEACLSQGNAVTSCTIDVLKEANSKAPEEFKKYTDCMDYYSNKFKKCRKEQAAFEEAFPISIAPVTP